MNGNVPESIRTNYLGFWVWVVVLEEEYQEMLIDGFVEYDAEIQDRTNRVCTTCDSARGYYACPD